MRAVRNLPKRSDAYTLYRVFKNILTILQKRGYDTFEYQHYLDDETTDRSKYDRFLADDIHIPYEKSFVLTDPGQSWKQRPYTLNVRIHHYDKQAVKLNSEIIEYFKNPDRDSNGGYLVVYDLPKDLRNNVGDNYLEVLCFQQLLIDPLKHKACPLSITRLSDEEKEELLGSEALNGKKLAKLRPGDPLTLFVDAVPGDVLRYKEARTYTEQSLSTYEYRMVG